MKRVKGDHGHLIGDDGTLLKQEKPFINRMNTSYDQPQTEQQLLRGNGMNIGTPTIPTTRPSNTQLTHSAAVTNVPNGTSGARDRQCELRLSIFAEPWFWLT